MALPVHAERRATTTTRCRCRCSPTSNWQRHAAQADALGESQRLLLRARPRRPASSCSGKPFVKVNWASGLDERAGRSRRRSRRARRPGPATRAAPTGTRRRSARAPGSSMSPPGRTTRRSTARRKPSTSPGAISPAAASRVLTPAPGAPTVGIGRRGPINNWTDEVGNGAVIAIDPQTGEHEVEVRAVRRHRQRHPDHRVGPAVHGRPRGLLLRARRARPARCCGRRAWAARSSSGPITLSRSTGGMYVATIGGNVLAVYGLRD